MTDFSLQCMMIWRLCLWGATKSTSASGSFTSAATVLLVSEVWCQQHQDAIIYNYVCSALCLLPL